MEGQKLLAVLGSVLPGTCLRFGMKFIVFCAALEAWGAAL